MIDVGSLFGAPDEAGEMREFHVYPRSGRPRWMLQTSFRRPWHLKTWRRTNLRAKAIYAAAWAL